MSSDDGIDDMWGKLLAEAPGSALRPKSGSRNDPEVIHATLETEQSSTILEALYDPGKEIFSVSFRYNPDLKYVFYRVPSEVGKGFFENLKQNQSPGKYFHKEIQGRFSFLKETKPKKK